MIYERADADKPHMGLTTWAAAPEGKIVKSDVSVAKNYLSEQEMRSLERIVSAYLDLAEDRAERHIPMTMEDWSKRLDLFLMADDREVLQDAGKITVILTRQKLKLNLKNIVLFRTDCLCLTLISTCWNWKRIRKSSIIAIKIFSLPRSSAWKLGYQSGRKIGVDLFLYEEQTMWRRWQFFAEFDFYVGITIIVETNKKLNFFREQARFRL